MLNHLSKFPSKRTTLFSFLVILILLIFSTNHLSQIEASNSSKEALEQINKAFYRVPAQKLHGYTTTANHILLVATDLGLLTFDGKNWQNILPEETFAIKVNNVGHLLAGTRYGVNISKDNGKTWHLSNQGLIDGLVPLSIELTNNDSRVYIGTDRHGIFRSNDGGESWVKTSNGLPPAIGVNPFDIIKRLYTSPSEPDLVFASTTANGIYLSKDGGESWQKANLKLPGEFPYRVNPPFISFDDSSNTIYALINYPLTSHHLEHSIQKSTDGGNSWELVGKLDPNQTLLDFSVSNNSAIIKTAKGESQIDLIKLAEAESRKFLTADPVQPNVVIPGTDPDFEKDDVAILHDDGQFVDFFADNLKGFGQEVGKRFYQRHGDEYDVMVAFLDPSYILSFTDGALAYNLSVQNSIGGIGKRAGQFNGGPSAYGSKGRLLSFCNLGNLNLYPDNVNETFFITNSTLDVLSHEVAHTWSAYFRFDDNGVTSDELLGRQLAHWSFFFNSNASEVEGNTYQDLGNGTFRITGATSRYNDFDLYAMGLSSGASGSFIVSNPTAIDPKLQDSQGGEFDITRKDSRGLPPLAPPDFPTLTVTGTRKNVSLADIMKVEGPRIPDKDVKPLRVGFVLLVPPGKEPEPESLFEISNIRKSWLKQFASITNNRSVDASLPFRDGSDKVAPKITVKGPNGGDVIPSGAIITISWDSSDPGGIAKHDILLSLDGGASYSVEVAKFLNGQTKKFDYKVPEDIFSNDVRIKVVATDYAGNKAEDVNDASFQIQKENTPPTVVVNKPNGGEQILAGMPFLITWTSTDNGTLQSHDVNVSLDGGKSFRPIFSGIPGRTQSFLWQVPPDLFSNDARIQVIAKDSSGNSGSDTSDKSFSIVQKDVTAPQVQLISPIGGEKLQANGSFNITWSSSDNSQLASHELQLSTNGGQNFDTTIVSGLSGSTRNFIWQVPNVEINSARVKIIATDAQNNSSQDASSQNVIITKQDVTAPVVKVMSPNGGEATRAGENLLINWQSTDNVAITSQRISLSLDGGNTFSVPIIDSLGATASTFTFKLPDNLQSSKARIRVEAIDTNGLVGRDISDADFSISGKDTVAPQVKVISPNGSEVLANSDSLKVSWQVSDNVGVVSQDIQISTDGGANYTNVQTGLAGSVQEFTLDIRSIQSERTKIKIVARDAQNNSGSDDSDSAFAVLAKPFISDAKYNSGTKKLTIFATTISATTEVTINNKIISLSKKFKANKGTLILKGSLSDLNLRSGDNILVIKERGLVSSAYKLNLP